MTTLVFLEIRSYASTEPSPLVSLREWLGQHWAILFSHPADFDQEQLERDRWIRVLERGFSEHAVRPLALARHGHGGRGASLGWLDELGDGCAAELSTAMPLNPWHDLRASTLRAKINHSSARFAMIIDPALRCRQMVRYRVPIDLPSPLELLGWAVALRGRHGTTARSCKRRHNGATARRPAHPPILSSTPDTDVTLNADASANPHRHTSNSSPR